MNYSAGRQRTPIVVAVVVVVIVVRPERKQLIANAGNPDGKPTQPRRSLTDRLFREDEWRTWPNLITAIRLLLLPVFAWLITASMLWAAFAVIGVVFLTDWLDGWLARRTNKVSELGIWLDPVADRLTVFVVAGAFVLGQLVPWETFVLLLIPDLLLGLAALFVFKGDPNLPITIVGKILTALIFAGLLGVLLGSALAESTGQFDWIVDFSFAIYLIGIVGHYIAGGQYARGMIARRVSNRSDQSASSGDDQRR